VKFSDQEIEALTEALKHTIETYTKPYSPSELCPPPDIKLVCSDLLNKISAISISNRNESFYYYSKKYYTE
jgi:hypothetical protein